MYLSIMYLQNEKKRKTFQNSSNYSSVTSLIGCFFNILSRIVAEVMRQHLPTVNNEVIISLASCHLGQWTADLVVYVQVLYDLLY